MRPPSRGVLAALAAILALGALLRLSYLGERRGDPDFARPEVDAGFHDYWARGLAAGDWAPPEGQEDPLVRSTAFLRPPGYPYFLAAVYRLLGTGPVAPRAIQSIFGLAACLLGFLLARRRFGDAAGLLFAALASTYWSFIYFEAELLEPSLLVLLGVLLLLLLDRWCEAITARRAILAGLVLGLLVVVRPTNALFGLFVLAWALFLPERRRIGARRLAPLLALFAGSAFAVTIPAIVRNFTVSKEPVLVSSGGINLYLGNNEHADGRVASQLAGLGRFGTCFDYPRLGRALERKLGRRMTGKEISDYFRDEALRFVLDHPGRALQLAGRKTLFFFGPLEVGHNREDEAARASSPVLRLLPVGFAFALAIFGLGLFVLLLGRRFAEAVPAEAWRAQASLVVLGALFVLSTWLAHLPFFVAGRYRVPMVPALLLVGAFGLTQLGKAIVRKRVGLSVVTLCVGVALLELCTRNPTGYATDWPKWHFSRGLALSNQGDRAAARREYLEALQLDPVFAPAHMNLGVLDLREGDLPAAETHLRAALASDATDPLAHHDLAIVLALQGKQALAEAERAAAVSLDPELVHSPPLPAPAEDR